MPVPRCTVLINRIPEGGTKVAVDNVSDLVVCVEVFGIKRNEASSDRVKLSVRSLLLDLISRSVLAVKCPVHRIRRVSEAERDWVVALAEIGSLLLRCMIL